MHKRVLLAESSDTIRGVANSMLQQNGYEVISVSSAAKCLEVLNYSKPDILIVGSELNSDDQRLLYERITGDARFSSIPMLLLSQPDSPELPFPPELIISMPFDPRELLERVAIFTGQAQGGQELPLVVESARADDNTDNVLDAALGLDQLEVTDSEVMDKTTGTSSKKGNGFSETGQVETNVIPEERSDIVQLSSKSTIPHDFSASSKLDILTNSDQYSSSHADAMGQAREGETHDYDWFINEMQNKQDENSAVDSVSANKPDTIDSHMSITEPSELVDPITPPPGKQADTVVEKFIDEFKKEIDKVRSDEPESILLEAEAQPQKTVNQHKWQESLETIGPKQIDTFVRELSASLAERIADRVMSQLDSKKLLEIIREEIRIHFQKKTDQ